MYSIKDTVTCTTEINKSKFICKIVRLNDINQVEEELNIVKREFKDATHYCYAYIFKNVKRFSDDGEPGGTAGMPILNVIETNNLANILVIVIRYYGGVKLGAGGLVRAYTNSTVNALNIGNVIELLLGKKIKIVFEYDQEKTIKQRLPNIKILEKIYLEKIEYLILINNIDYETLKELNIDVDIVENDIYLEK
jgi:Uncharacterized conserved protein